MAILNQPNKVTNMMKTITKIIFCFGAFLFTIQNTFAQNIFPSSGTTKVGTLSVEGIATFNDALSLNGPSLLFSSGRMTLYGGELLYLSNKSGVIISKDWGGTGSLSVQGTASVNDVLTLNGPSQLYSPGRMHVNGEEFLYLLNKSGVVIGKELGGNGNLSVQGNLVVGSVTPVAGYKLQVEEGILAEKVKIALKSSGDWSDYVFGQDYKLKPLSEVETFINRNKHLPGVPSANELVKEGGINVNEMFAMQMEKIEELTLYLIEVKKEINALKKENEVLKARITSTK
jgi:filamentous hemagglutinin family protein